MRWTSGFSLRLVSGFRNRSGDSVRQAPAWHAIQPVNHSRLVDRAPAGQLAPLIGNTKEPKCEIDDGGNDGKVCSFLTP